MRLLIHVVLLTVTSCAPRRQESEASAETLNWIDAADPVPALGLDPEAQVFHLVINGERKQRSVFILPDTNWLRRLIPRVVDVADSSECHIEDVVQASVDDPLRVNVVKTQVTDETQIPVALQRLGDLLRIKNFRSRASSRSGSLKKTPRTLNVIIVNVIQDPEGSSTTSAPVSPSELDQSIPFIQRPPTVMEKEYLKPYASIPPPEEEYGYHGHAPEPELNNDNNRIPDPPEEIRPVLASEFAEGGPEVDDAVSVVAKPITSITSITKIVRKGFLMRMKLAIPTLAGLATSMWWPVVASLGRRKRCAPAGCSKSRSKRGVPEAPADDPVEAVDADGRAIEQKWLDILLGKKYSNATKAELKTSIDDWKFRGENRTSASVSSGSSGSSGRETTSARSTQTSTPFSSESRIDAMGPEVAVSGDKPEVNTEMNVQARSTPAGISDTSSADYDIVNNFLKVTLENLDQDFEFTKMPENDAYVVRKTPGDTTGSVTNSPITYVSLNPLYPPGYVSLLFDQMSSGSTLTEAPVTSAPVPSSTSATTGMVYALDVPSPITTRFPSSTTSSSSTESTWPNKQSSGVTLPVAPTTSAGGTSSLVSDAITNQQLLELILKDVNSESTTSAGWTSSTGYKPSAGSTTSAGSTPSAGSTTSAGWTSSAGYKPPTGSTASTGWPSSAGYKPSAGWTSASVYKPSAGSTPSTEWTTGYKPSAVRPSTTSYKPSTESTFSSGLTGSRPAVAANIVEAPASGKPAFNSPLEPESGIPELLNFLQTKPSVPSEPEAGLPEYQPETGDPIEPEAPLAGIITQLKGNLTTGLVGITHPSAGIHFVNSDSDVIELDPFNSSTWSPFSIQPLPIEAALLEQPPEALITGASTAGSDAVAVEAEESQLAPPSTPDVSPNAHLLLPGALPALAGIVDDSPNVDLAGHFTLPLLTLPYVTLRYLTLSELPYFDLPFVELPYVELP